jgi:Fe2+ transport system protein FeoA
MVIDGGLQNAPEAFCVCQYPPYESALINQIGVRRFALTEYILKDKLGECMEKTLNELKPGEKGSVMRVTAVGLIRRRLFDMGVTPGAVVMMRKAAPFGDPLEVTLRGYELSLRKVEAAGVLLEVLS